jgi:hypothetical protein
VGPISFENLKPLENKDEELARKKDDSKPMTTNWVPINNMERCLNLHFEHVKEQTEAAVFSGRHHYRADLKEKLVSLQKTRHLNLSIHIQIL